MRDVRPGKRPLNRPSLIAYTKRQRGRIGEASIPHQESDSPGIEMGAYLEVEMIGLPKHRPAAFVWRGLSPTAFQHLSWNQEWVLVPLPNGGGK